MLEGQLASQQDGLSNNVPLGTLGLPGCVLL